MVIGVTGNSGSGKSKFCKELCKIANFELIDADKIAKELSEPGKEYYLEILKEFGEEILLENSREINRKKLAEIIFTNSEKKNKLNNITYKYVVNEMKSQIKDESKTYIMDAPLLIESGLNKLCNIVISVIADENIKIERIYKRDNIDKKNIIERLEAQPKEEYYIKNSNYVIKNNNANLAEEAEEFFKLIENKQLFNNEIVILKNENIKYIKFKRMLEYKNVEHCFSLMPLDFGDNKTYNAKENLVKKNYENICKELNLDSKNIVRAYQTHTKEIKKVTQELGIFPKELTDVDGLITENKNKILSLTFADCTPIYLYDTEKNVIGNIHSGWQGTTKKIAQNAIIEMKKQFNSNPENIICFLGPTIRKCHFEVKQDVKDIFYNTFKYMNNIEEIINYNKETDTYFIDTVAININLLKEEGILEKNIIDSKICTYCNSNIMHSFRKDKEKSGRNTSLICLK